MPQPSVRCRPTIVTRPSGCHAGNRHSPPSRNGAKDLTWRVTWLHQEKPNCGTRLVHHKQNPMAVGRPERYVPIRLNAVDLRKRHDPTFVAPVRGRDNCTSRRPHARRQSTLRPATSRELRQWMSIVSAGPYSRLSSIGPTSYCSSTTPSGGHPERTSRNCPPPVASDCAVVGARPRRSAESRRP